MKTRNRLIAIAVGALSAALAFYLLHQKASELERKSTPTQVLVASRYIPAHSYLRAEMFQKKEIPEIFVSPSAIHDLREVDGLSTLVPISAGEQIMSNKFGPFEESLSSSLSPGFRAYTLQVTETTGVGHLLRPGDRVDVLSKINSKNKQEITAFVFQDLRVLAVGEKMNRGRRSIKIEAGQPEDSFQSQEPNASYSHVTLAVTPEQAETLMFLEGSNPIRLLLRAPGDEEIVSTSQQSEAEVLSRVGHFSKAKDRKIEVIRGLQNPD